MSGRRPIREPCEPLSKMASRIVEAHPCSMGAYLEEGAGASVRPGDLIRMMLGVDPQPDKPMQHETIWHEDGTRTHVEFPDGLPGGTHVFEGDQIERLFGDGQE